MATLKTQYILELTKKGDGVSLAVKDFATLDAAAQRANAGMAGAAAGSQALQTTTKGTAAAFKALNPVLTLIGLQSFPQLASAGLLTKSALDGVRASGVALNASLATTSAGIAGLIALVVAAGFAWSAYKAQQEEAMMKSAVTDQTQWFGERLKEQLQEMKNEGDITLATFERLVALAGSISGNQQIRDFINNERRGNAQDRINDYERELSLQDSILAAQGKNLRSEKDAKIVLEERIALYEQLGAEGLITNRQMVELADKATIAFNNQLGAIMQLKAPLTDLQKLGASVAQTFASGLSSAIVQSFKEGGKALQEFAAQFFAQVAQMILQLLILKALKGAFGGALGLASGGTVLAASGGLFPAPTYAANGVSGVSSVSQPTFFPKFNVVAGEAGREMLTVLARPRFMAVGGMQAVVGNAGGNRLAITNADDLARGGAGAGGSVQIHVSMEPGLRGEIVQESVKGAVVTVTNDAGRDSKLSRTIKQLR